MYLNESIGDEITILMIKYTLYSYSALGLIFSEM